MWVKIGTHPKLKGYLSDPTYVTALQAMQSNPSMAMGGMGGGQDPRVMETMLFLMGIDPSQMQGGAPGAGGMSAAEAKAAEEEREAKAAAEAAAAAKAAETPEEKEEREAKEAEAAAAAARAEEAAVHKAEGTKHYKAKEFEEALAAYAKAAEVCPEDITFLTNRAAVFTEMGEFDKCFAECDKAIEAGRERMAPYTMIAKCFARKGHAYFKQKDWAGAIEAYESAQMESTTDDVHQRLKKCKRLKEKYEKAAYLSPEEGVLAKERGNAHFKEGQWPEAIKEYTDAIKRDPTQAAFYSNRCACYQKQMAFDLAQEDGMMAIKIDPTYMKAYVRLGHIQYFLKEYKKAMETYQKGLAVDETNQECKDGLARTVAAVQGSMGGGEVDKERAARGMADPEIQNILRDPMMQQVLKDLSEQPDTAASRAHLQNAEVADKIQKLIAAGVLRTA
jgi:stress-induced-phosphoprotein 1